MQIAIDNLNGSGPIDYTGCIESSRPVLITRKLNAPSECVIAILPESSSRPIPARYSRVSIADDAGTLLFTGYVALSPELIVVGAGTAGLSYAALITAISDEVLMDSLLSVKPGTALNQPLRQTLQTLATTVGSTELTFGEGVSTAIVGRYDLVAGSSWSTAAGTISSSTRGAYRIVGGVTSVAPIGSVVHQLNEEDGSLQLSALRASSVKLLANDVTVCGKVEPAAFVTEILIADGVTKEFTLSAPPFEPIASEKLVFNDLFQGAILNGQMWQSLDSESRISITGGGVSCSGGTGRDGETVISAVHQVELGGSIVLEAGGVQLSGTGLVLGLYEGSVSLQNCFASFQLSGVSGATQVSALVNGVQAGGTMQAASAHTYTLRLRLYCPEMERIHQSYYYLDAEGVNSYGGDIVSAPSRIVMEIQDVTSGAPGLPTVLYEGMMTTTPPACTIGLLNSGALTCSIRSFACTQSGPNWVTLAPAGGTATSQYLGATAQGGSCKLVSGGKLSFYTGTVPPASAVITVSYRTRHRAVARRSIPQQNTSSGATTLAPATQMWMGTVTAPTAWSSTDCDNAAAALLKSSSAASAAWAGSYTGWNVETHGDVWPGDVLAITSTSASLDVPVVVREVEIRLGTDAPQMVKYSIRFANDWAEELALRLSNAVPQDAWLPTVPNAGGAPLPNLLSLQVTQVTSSQIYVNAGAVAPAGGGFEVKRKDWTFGPGVDSDLVLRTPTSNFTIPRVAAVEQYYIRMYDGATPPNYSLSSSAIFLDVALGTTF